MNERCPNCETELSSEFKFCPTCGQPNHSHKVPIKHFILDLLEGFFHFDTKLLITLRDLFIPGKMTTLYNQNKRARYVPPIRFYIFISFFFFLFLSFDSESSTDENTTANLAENHIIISENTTVSADTTDNYIIEKIKESDHPKKMIDDYIDQKYADSGWLTKKIQRNILLFNTGNYDIKEFKHRIQKATSYSMFLLMPVMALYLKLLYRRRKYFYSEHLIFSLHLHTLAFILLSIWLLLGMINIDVDLIVILLILAYSLLYIKKVYGQGWSKSIAKFLILSLTYTSSILIVIIFGFLVSIIF